MAKDLTQVRKTPPRQHLDINCEDSELLEEIVYLLEISLGDYKVERINEYKQKGRNVSRVYLKIDKLEEDDE